MFLTLSGLAATIGAALWAYKGVAVLITGDQPAYFFEVALFFFGAAAGSLAWALRAQIRPMAIVLGWLAIIGGTVAAAAYIIDGDDEGLFGPAALVTFLSILTLFFLIGRHVQRRDLLPRRSFAPLLVAWTFVLSIPIGSALSAVNERLLEVPLLAVVTAWVVLAAATLSPPPES